MILVKRLLCTGVRNTELAHVQLRDVDLDHGHMVLLQARLVICDNGRIVSIPNHRRPALSDHPLFTSWAECAGIYAMP